MLEVIHRVSGIPWDQFFAERIFKPLGMNETRTTDLFDIVPNRASGYLFRDGVQRNALPLMALRPGGPWLSTLRDLVKWDAAITEGNVVTHAIRDQMWTPTLLADGSSTHYGFGFWADEVAGHRRIRHGGSEPGVRTEYTRFEYEKVDIIVLVNGESVRPDDIALEVANQFIPGLSPARNSIALPASALAEFAGKYQIAPSIIATIAVDGGGLSIESNDSNGQFHLTAETASVFFLSKDESYGFTREGDRVTQLEVRFGTAASAGASELKAPRIP